MKYRNMSLLGLVYNIHGKDYAPEIVADSLKIFKKALGRYGFPEKVVVLPDIKESRAIRWDVLITSM
jgi:hypothetical protein